ncbi:hypothetical protein LWI29_025846 [Acer saccharum]|uniref:RNase H type-1 domain-containing protein n=1 Tax=Acer saccharum TaxID=4024 RepID=A0AA39W8S8_ACESA|nr:hypothetical protein LWI29_025846 [Acer saccharum]
MEGQVSRGQDKSTYGVETFTITYSEKRISSPTTNKDDQLEQQIGFGHTRAHSGTLGHTHSGNNKTVANTCNQQPAEVSGRLTKWAIELSEFDIEYLPRTAIKGQAVADFVAEFTEPNMEAAKMVVEQTKKKFKWQLHVNGSSNTHGSGAGVVVSTSEGDSVECALRFDFKSTNNQAEYEALIAGLRVCTVLGADEVEIFSDSQVIVNQVLDEYQARDENMIAYLKLAKELLGRFKEYIIVQVPREENEQAKLASATINIWPRTIPHGPPTTAEHNQTNGNRGSLRRGRQLDDTNQRVSCQ